MLTDAFGLPQPLHISCDAEALLPLPAQLAMRASGTPGGRAERAVARLNEKLALLDGSGLMALTVKILAPDAPLALGVDESYQLHSDATGVSLSAATDIGVLRGLQTLQQILFLQNGLPHCQIDDRPRFPWRGLLLDVARHYLSLETLRRTLDCMAAAKLNVLHLHLTDDQGFRFHSARFPR
ncbi:MAG: family 20 glycosylhydrolase, partial [Pseudomonadales bacterium]